MSGDGNGAKGIIFKTAYSIAGAAMLLLVNDMRTGIRRMETKIDIQGDYAAENRGRILVLEENRKQMDKALENQQSIIRELQKLNRTVAQ